MRGVRAGDSGTEVLDGLRGVAILLVLIFHTWLFSWYTPALKVLGIELPVDVIARVGYLGVDLFFVISGFVLFFPHAVRAMTGAGRTHAPREFAIRRFVKIVPSYAIAFAVTAISLQSLNKPFALLPEIVKHGLFVNDFFDDPLGYANSVFWSLAIEAQFYVVFLPIAAAFRRLPIVVAVAMVAIAFAYREYTAPHYLLYEPVYRQLPAFLDVFAAGMFAAYALVWIRTHLADTPALRGAFTLGAIASASAIWALFSSANAVQYDPGGPERWDLVYRTYLAWAFAAFAVTSCAAFPAWRAAIANPVLVFFSLISYNLYLWHTLVMIWLWRGDKLPHAIKDMHSDDHWKALFIAISWTAAILISTALTYFFERPLIALVAPQSFSFDWARIVRAVRARRRPHSTASAGRRS